MKIAGKSVAETIAKRASQLLAARATSDLVVSDAQNVKGSSPEDLSVGPEAMVSSCQRRISPVDQFQH